MHVSTRVNRCLLLPLALLCTWCGAPADDGTRAPEDESIGTERQAIKNGYVLSSETYSGIVALQIWQVDRFVTVCSGALMTNNKVLTARHCNTYFPQTQWAKMGTQRIQVTARELNAPWDVAVFKLGGSMVMPNWRYDHFLTSPVQHNSTDYARSIYSGTNASLNGATLTCIGYGGATLSGPVYEPPLTYGLFAATYPLAVYGWGGEALMGIDSINPSNAYMEGGDSGAPCLDYLSTFGSAIAGVHSGSELVVAAGDWRVWAAWVILFW